MIDITNRQLRLPAPTTACTLPVALTDLPPLDERYHPEVWLQVSTLLTVAGQLGAQTFSLVEDEVTFSVRDPGTVQRWRGRLGHRGVVPV